VGKKEVEIQRRLSAAMICPDQVASGETKSGGDEDIGQSKLSQKKKTHEFIFEESLPGPRERSKN